MRMQWFGHYDSSYAPSKVPRYRILFAAAAGLNGFH